MTVERNLYFTGTWFIKVNIVTNEVQHDINDITGFQILK